MIDQEIIAYSGTKGLHKQTLDRWLKLAEVDRQALWDLVQELKLGENHLRDFLDWLEEIALRDGGSLSAVLKGESLRRISSDPRLGRSDKLKRVKEELRRIRFPRLARMEEAIFRRIHDLKLKPQIQITVPPGLEGRVLTLQIKINSYEELKRSVDELGQALENEAMREIFALLEGRTEKLVAEQVLKG